jgi:hypothetical protein
MENNTSENNFKISFGKVVSYTNIHLFVGYEIFITNYAVEMTITWPFVLKLVDVHT